MEKLQISAKVLGGMALPDFCPRCFFLKLYCKPLPWQIFPGIFSSLDSMQKKVVRQWIDTEAPVKFLQDYEVTGYIQKVPNWRTFYIETKQGIKLTGVADDIWIVPKGIAIPDFKTSRWTANQDKLLPMYRVQLNSYARIAQETGMGSVRGIPLIYFEPQTTEEDAAAAWKPSADGFRMQFLPYVLDLDLDIASIDPLLDRAREIYEGRIPDPGPDCKDCMAIEKINVLTNIAEGA